MLKIGCEHLKSFDTQNSLEVTSAIFQCRILLSPTVRQFELRNVQNQTFGGIRRVTSHQAASRTNGYAYSATS